ICRMISPSPAAKTKVIATSARLVAKLLAKYAGSITEMQQGANSATVPARNEASTAPPKRICVIGWRGPLGVGGGLATSQQCNYTFVVVRLPRRYRPGGAAAAG